MAASKKAPKKTAKKSTAKSSGTKTQKKSATATEIERMREEVPSNGKKQMRAILLFALAVFFMFVAIIKTEEHNVWFWLNKIMFGLFGICAYIMPVLLGIVAILGAMDKFSGKFAARLTESGFLVWFICAAMDIFSGVSERLPFVEHVGKSFDYDGVFGGVFGAALGHPMYKALGEIGSKITVIILIVVVLMFVTGTTLISAYGMLSKPIRSAGQAIENHMEEREQRRAVSKEPRFDVDVPIAGENRGPHESVEEITERPLNVAEKRRKVIATYRGVEYNPENAEESQNAAESSGDLMHSKTSGTAADAAVEAAGVTINGVAAAAHGAAESVGNKTTTDTDTDEKTADTAEKSAEASEKDAEIPKGLSLNEIPQDENAYRFPPLSLLQEGSGGGAMVGDYEATGEQLVNILRSFGVETKIINISVGPSITRYELQPAAGVKISKITSLSDDIAMNLATAGVRIEAPIPNKPAVGIEVPNKNSRIVTVREIIDSKAFTSSKSKLTVAMGKDIAGTPIVTDIAKMPHGLIAGATGSGKSVCINSIIVSLLYNATPDEVKLLMIDPKVVELGIYNGIPHLLVPVVTDPRKAAGALGWAVTEMEKRYKMFAENDVRNLEGYNRLAEKNDDMIKMPHIVIIIDELADLMMTAPHEVEDSICRIAQKARAAGMHLLIATQRPSVDVITGIIKANIPSRIAFAVSSAVDSRTILDMGGAERLMGRGDMLFNPVGAIKPRRIQGCFVSDSEVEAVVEFIKGVRTDEYDSNIMEEIERQAASSKDNKKGGDQNADEEADPMLQAAIECVVENGQASTSLLQRRLKLGYARAARIMDSMAERGIIGPYEGAKPRAVLITKAQLMEMQARRDEVEY